MQPARQDIDIVAGDDETLEFEFTTNGTELLDITGRTYKVEVRAKPGVAGAADCSFACSINTSTSTVTCTAPDTATAALVAGRVYYWSLLQNVSGYVSTLISGQVTVHKQVTKQ